MGLRLVFAVVARHFLSEEELLGYVAKDHNSAEQDFRGLLQQVQGRDYNSPLRKRILGSRRSRNSPYARTPNDPEACNVNKDLRFSDGVYENIQFYQTDEIGSPRRICVHSTICADCSLLRAAKLSPAILHDVKPPSDSGLLFTPSSLA